MLGGSKRGRGPELEGPSILSSCLHRCLLSVCFGGGGPSRYVLGLSVVGITCCLCVSGLRLGCMAMCRCGFINLKLGLGLMFKKSQASVPDKI
jgi:hypothetical protein